MTTLLLVLLGAVPAPDPAATATLDERPSRAAIQRRLQAIAADLEGASEFRDAVRQSARILSRTEVPFQALFLAPPAEEQSTFRDSIASTQKNASLVHFRLQTVLDDLTLAAAARGREERRWRAYNDYVSARLCIEIDQAYSYNALLGQMRKEFFPAARVVGWRLVQTKEARPDLERLGARDKARVHLQRLIDDNPGTAWDHLARQELQALTYRWKWELIGR